MRKKKNFKCFVNYFTSDGRRLSQEGFYSITDGKIEADSALGSIKRGQKIEKTEVIHAVKNDILMTFSL